MPNKECKIGASEQVHKKSQGWALRQLSMSSTHVQNSFNPHQHLNINRKLVIHNSQKLNKMQIYMGDVNDEPHPQGIFLARKGLNCCHTVHKGYSNVILFTQFVHNKVFMNKRQNSTSVARS